jgi:hypothetical protein
MMVQYSDLMLLSSRALPSLSMIYPVLRILMLVKMVIELFYLGYSLSYRV